MSHDDPAGAGARRLGAERPLPRQLARLSGRRRRLGIEAVRALHDFGSGGFLPDRTLLLELPAEAATDRLSVRDAEAGPDRGQRGRIITSGSRRLRHAADEEPDASAGSMRADRRRGDGKAARRVEDLL
jgi:hypothetical protein